MYEIKRNGDRYYIFYSGKQIYPFGFSNHTKAFAMVKLLQVESHA